MERIEWVHLRFERWARWSMAGIGVGCADFSIDRVDGVRPADVAVDADAMETDRAIAQLPVELKNAVKAAYWWEGSVESIAQKLRISRRTLHNRLCHADRRVRDWIEAREQRSADLKRGEFLQLSQNPP